MIKRTGQGGKVLVTFGGVVLGGVLMVLSSLALEADAPTVFGILMLGGMALTFGFGAYGVLALRCPACGQRWMWRAMRKESAGRWLHSLAAWSTCPGCGQPSP